MFNFLKYSILFTTLDIEHYEKVKNILTKNDIFFISRVRSNTHGKSGLGQLGENSNFSSVYEILVKHKDYEKAKILANLF